MARSKSGKKGDGRPWRENIEAITVSVIVIVLFKYFVLEAYKIPTGSMQPTLMGNEETGIFDRVIVDKLSYHFRDPERFEIAVFKYPLDSSKNYIKRIVGMPGERLRIENGDLFVTPSGETEERVEFSGGSGSLDARAFLTSRYASCCVLHVLPVPGPARRSTLWSSCVPRSRAGDGASSSRAGARGSSPPSSFVVDPRWGCGVGFNNTS